MARVVYTNDNETMVIFDPEKDFKEILEIKIGRDIVDLYNDIQKTKEQEILESIEVNPEFEMIADERYKLCINAMDSFQEAIDMIDNSTDLNKMTLLRELLKSAYNELYNHL